MESAAGRNDLVVLVADKDMEMALQGIFSRRESLSALGIRSFTYEIYRHPEHDPGCYKSSHEILRSSHQLFDHALVLFDYEGVWTRAAKKSGRNR